MLRGGNVTVILYCLDFHIFRLFHVMNTYVASCNILLFQFNAVKFPWTAAIVLFFALHNSLMLMQWSTAIFIKHSCWGYKSFVIGNVHLCTFLSSWSYRLQYLCVLDPYGYFFVACCVQCTFNCLNWSGFPYTYGLGGRCQFAIA